MPTTFEKERTLTEQIVPRVTHDVPGVDVLAVELLSPTRFCVFVDHPDGVDHELCVRVSSLLRDYLAEYTVDVSSPGTTRPLRRPEHFSRFVGHKISLRTAEPVDGRSKFKGTLKDAGTSTVTVGVEDADVKIPYAAIVRGNLIDER